MLDQRLQPVRVTAADLEPRDATPAKKLKLLPGTDEMRDEDPLGGSLDQHRAVGKENITVRRFQVALDESRGLILRAERLGEVHHARDGYATVPRMHREPSEVS